MSDPVPPGLEFVAAVAIPVLDKPLGSGKGVRGTRQLIAFPGGTVSGPGLSGRVLPGGADVQLIRGDGVAEIDAKYFRTSPTFETDGPDLQWLMQHVFVGTGAVSGGGVELRWYKVT